MAFDDVTDRFQLVSHLYGLRQRQPAVLHQVGDADRGRAAASILAVDDSVSSVVRLLLDGVGAALEVAEQVLVGVVVHGDLQLLDAGGGKRLLLGHVDAECHRLLLKQLITAG